MVRVRSPLQMGAMVALGIVVGLTLDRVGRPLEAQSDAKVPAAGTNTPAATPRAATEQELYDQLARQYDRFAEIDRTFSLVAQAVSPSVVHIVARKPGPVEDQDTGSRIIEETGSGVIVRPDGQSAVFVLTNHHVVSGSRTEDITVTLHDGRVLQPLALWTDPKADVAVLELGRDDLPVARLGDSDRAVVGTWVLALGSPFGLTHSISQGIISARNRHEPELEDEGVENQEFLQTDAAINPGNSGGPLVNLKGEVIGLNTAIASNGGGSEGVGFSIPINLAKWIMTQLVSNHRVNRGALGVRLQDVAPQHATDLGLDRPRGARILHVQSPSPAFEAGVRTGDVVLRFNGTEVLDINHLINLVSMAPIGQSAEMIVWRDRQTMAFKVTIADRDTLLADAAPEPDSARGPLRRPSVRPAPTSPAEGSQP